LRPGQRKRPYCKVQRWLAIDSFFFLLKKNYKNYWGFELANRMPLFWLGFREYLLTFLSKWFFWLP
jgi:hypothetical protein